jgi:hypothetical protein
MLQRQRIYELILGDYKSKIKDAAILINSLQVTFDVSKSSDNKRKSNTANIQVYNLADSTLSKLDSTEYLGASLSCGYEESGLINLITGQVTSVNTRKSGADKVTTIVIGEGYVELNQQYLKGITPAGSTVEQTIEEIRKQMPGVVKGSYVGLNKDQQCLYGYPLSGTPRQMLNEICEANRMEYRIDRGALYITDEAQISDKNLTTAFLLTETTGLVDIPYRTTADGAKLKGDKTKRKGVQFKALLNGRIFPGSPVVIQSKLISGTFKVVNARYYGGYNDNDWYIDCYCEELLTGDIPK